MEDLDASYGTFAVENERKPSTKSNRKHKKKKNKHNKDNIKEQSTKKKKKNKPQRTKKKNRKNNNKQHKKKKNKKNKKKRGKKQVLEHQYKIGSVIVLPQSRNVWGWIYCKTDNIMYKLTFSAKTATLQKDQKVLFTSHSNIVIDIDRINIISLDTVNNKYLNDKKETVACNDRFVYNTKINCVENNEVEFKSFAAVNYHKKFRKDFIKMIEKYLNGFLNMNGGTMYIGINDNGIVKGINFINNKEFDLIQQILPKRINNWKPEIYTRAIIKTLTLEMRDIIWINNREKCAYIVPKYKVIVARMKPIYNVNDEKEQIICYASDGFVYCREGTSLAVYSDVSMTYNHKCDKKKEVSGYNYGFWDAYNKKEEFKPVDLSVFDEGDDISESEVDDDDESHSIIYMDSDSKDIDSDEDERDESNMKYVRQYKGNDSEDNVDRNSYSALFDYNGGQISNELMFKRNDEIIVDDAKQNGLYLHGFKSNEPSDKGWFPNSYVKQNGL